LTEVSPAGDIKITQPQKGFSNVMSLKSSP